MPDLPLIDAHVHLYDPTAIRYAWMQNEPRLNSRHASAEFTAAICHLVVEKLIFVDVDAAPGEELAEARWVAAAAQSDNRIQAMIGSIAVDKGAAARHDLLEFCKLPHARGVRRLIQGHVKEPAGA